MALLHSTVHTSPQSEDNTTLVGLRKQSQTKEKESKAKEIHITVYTSDEESLAGQEVKREEDEGEGEGSWFNHNGFKPEANNTIQSRRRVFRKGKTNINPEFPFLSLNTKHFQVRGFPFWPAKVTKVSGTSVSVVFFGTKEVASLALRDLAKVSISKK